MNNYDFSSKKIIIYGENTNDKSAERNIIKLLRSAFRMYIYPGGLFEWLCLQDIYGTEYFSTTKPLLDILKYKPKSRF